MTHPIPIFLVTSELKMLLHHSLNPSCTGLLPTTVCIPAGYRFLNISFPPDFNIFPSPFCFFNPTSLQIPTPSSFPQRNPS